MNYEEKKAALRSRVASEFQNISEYQEIICDLLTEKLMANEFNQTFYQGNGKTNRGTSQSLMSLNLKTRVKSLIKGLGASLIAVLQVAKAINRSQNSESFGWVYGIPPQYYSSTEKIAHLAKFLDSTLASQQIVLPDKFYLQSGRLRNVKVSERLEIVPHLGSKVLSIVNQNKFRTILQIVKRTLIWLSLSARLPSLLLIGPEYIVDIATLKLIDSQKKIGKNQVFITTQSHLLAPPLVFKSSITAERVMYWYSDNSIQITTKNVGMQDYTYLIQPQISRHFVWTSTWGDILKSNNMNSFVIPWGPIMFRSLDDYPRISRLESNRTYKVTIFDVTPKKNASAESIYSEEVMIKFLVDIIETVKKRMPSAIINLKPKRSYSSVDSRIYRDLTTSQSSSLNVLSWDCDIFDQIINSNLVICIPFTSPGLIGSYFGVQTAYYVPTHKFNLNATHERIPVLQGRESLTSFLDESIVNSF